MGHATVFHVGMGTNNVSAQTHINNKNNLNYLLVSNFAHKQAKPREIKTLKLTLRYNRFTLNKTDISMPTQMEKMQSKGILLLCL